jgi:hypothetical protein
MPTTRWGASDRYVTPSAAMRSTGMSVAPGVRLLSLPFDAMRFQYASAVRSGVLQRSSLASGRMERSLDAWEQLLLGPLARQR